MNTPTLNGVYWFRGTFTLRGVVEEMGAELVNVDDGAAYFFDCEGGFGLSYFVGEWVGPLKSPWATEGVKA